MNILICSSWTAPILILRMIMPTKTPIVIKIGKSKIADILSDTRIFALMSTKDDSQTRNPYI